MKRLFCVILITVLALSTISVLATDSKTFNYQALEKLDGYQYDKFAKTWKYYQAYIKVYTDALIVLGIQLKGKNGDIAHAPVLYAIIMSSSGKPIHTVKSIDILVGESVFTYSKMIEGEGVSTVLLGLKGKALVEALAKADTIAVKLTWSYNNITEEISKEDFSSTLKVVCANLLKYDVWSFIQDEDKTKLLEDMFPLTISN